MKTTLVTSVAAGMLLAMAGVASAEPVQLSAAQMDAVTAGDTFPAGIGSATASGAAVGQFVTATQLAAQSTVNELLSISVPNPPNPPTIVHYNIVMATSQSSSSAH